MLQALGDKGDSGHTKGLAACQGDCDVDSHCPGDLQCFQRGAGATYANTRVPGCKVGTTGDVASMDYCYDPTFLSCKTQTAEASCGPGNFWTSAGSAAADNTCSACPANTFMTGKEEMAAKDVWLQQGSTDLWSTSQCPRIATISNVKTEQDCQNKCASADYPECGGISYRKGTKKCELVDWNCVSDPSRSGVRAYNENYVSYVHVHCRPPPRPPHHPKGRAVPSRRTLHWPKSFAQVCGGEWCERRLKEAWVAETSAYPLQWHFKT